MDQNCQQSQDAPINSEEFELLDYYFQSSDQNLLGLLSFGDFILLKENDKENQDQTKLTNQDQGQQQNSQLKTAHESQLKLNNESISNQQPTNVEEETKINVETSNINRSSAVDEEKTENHQELNTNQIIQPELKNPPVNLKNFYKNNGIILAKSFRSDLDKFLSLQKQNDLENDKRPTVNDMNLIQNWIMEHKQKKAINQDVPSELQNNNYSRKMLLKTFNSGSKYLKNYIIQFNSTDESSSFVMYLTKYSQKRRNGDKIKADLMKKLEKLQQKLIQIYKSQEDACKKNEQREEKQKK